MYGINRTVDNILAQVEIVYDIQMYGINRNKGKGKWETVIVYDIQMYGINRLYAASNS